MSSIMTSIIHQPSKIPSKKVFAGFSVCRGKPDTTNRWRNEAPPKIEKTKHENSNPPYDNRRSHPGCDNLQRQCRHHPAFTSRCGESDPSRPRRHGSPAGARGAICLPARARQSDYPRGQRSERRESRHGMPQDDCQSQGHSSLRCESRRHVGMLQNSITNAAAR